VLHLVPTEEHPVVQPQALALAGRRSADLRQARRQRGAALQRVLRDAKFVAVKRATIRSTGSPRADAAQPLQPEVQPPAEV
jgi:hypothetical protein